MHVDTDGIQQGSGPSEEPDDTAAVVHRDAEGRLRRVAKRAVLAGVGHERERPHDGVAAERTDSPGDLLDDLPRAELDLLAIIKKLKNEKLLTRCVHREW
jgi:hypothetical protein